MKENIEGKTKLENFKLLILDCKEHRKLYNESFVSEDDIEIMDNILSDYKRVLKDNEELKDKLLDIIEGEKVIEEETPKYIKENYILKDKIEEILAKTITDFNSLVEAFLEIKKLLESE